MVHNKQTYKTKEPVKMRFRKLADGSQSIYLDYYVNGRRSYDLDADEVVRLSVSACRNPEVKRAFLFSCFTGLRISDIRGLRWKDFKRVGDAWYFSIVMQKTQEPIVNKMSEEAVKWLGPFDGKSGEQLVFSLPGMSCLEHIISQWVRQAGIDKHVTFHTARHSYATMALMAGAIYWRPGCKEEKIQFFSSH